MKRTILALSLTVGVFAPGQSFAGKDGVNSAKCTFKGHPLFGKVKIVESFPDIKVQIVDSFPDLKVQIVDSFPDNCGQWQIVDSFSDVKIKYVDSFPDIKVQFVTSYPGLE